MTDVKDRARRYDIAETVRTLIGSDWVSVEELTKAVRAKLPPGAAVSIARVGQLLSGLVREGGAEARWREAAGAVRLVKEYRRKEASADA